MIVTIGHRGAAGHATENSIPSILKAIELGVDYVEIDVQATQDGELVVFHDRSLKRLTGHTGFLADYSFQFLRKEVRLSCGEMIPSLDEVCQIISEKNAKLMVEIKTSGIEEKAIRVLGQQISPEQYMIASFFHRSIFNAKKIKKDIQTIALMECNPLDLAKSVENTLCDCIGFGLDCLDSDLVDRSHEIQKKVFVWTVDDPEDILRMKNYGVDGIISNYPELVHLNSNRENL
jgi:glycerophosphoryl diester phosphodiesterase